MHRFYTLYNKSRLTILGLHCESWSFPCTMGSEFIYIITILHLTLSQEKMLSLAHTNCPYSLSPNSILIVILSELFIFSECLLSSPIWHGSRGSLKAHNFVVCSLRFSLLPCYSNLTGPWTSAANCGDLKIEECQNYFSGKCNVCQYILLFLCFTIFPGPENCSTYFQVFQDA